MPTKKEPLYVVRNSAIHGRGVFAARTIRKGTRIVEYTGERINDDEADRRYDEANMRRHHTFLFTLTSKTVVDGSPETGGGDASFINHSCQPNCEALIGEGEIHIYALQTIYPGTELLYDYQYEHTNDPKDRKFYLCRCGADSCRGTIMKAAKKRRSKAKKLPQRRRRAVR
jgi:SET domain-containing protein